ncbi:hypothetical protein OEIGOIKO_01840 [Streptomyces chrestomyceticus JCM 4735]|uniref:PTS EIIA type-2 domain-containing protein n=1 Tax=Streptomyces chrestomyceticus JCM 4735 TaxID=1306181 RepID=A0A7U9PX11_9ACTN|nr:PTS sugar transporter subunit IIA [Streptomyces chrestomyceticus]GCD34115.1 hypothetical protein OEIGOIKO_01840 [Streptomyces chrestomyceticus JCM 4735]
MTRARTVAGGTGSLADYLDKRHIHPRAQAATRDELLESLAGGLHAAGALGDVRAFVRAVRLRMTQGANGFHGIALLAAQSRAVNGPAAAFARIPPELGWRGADDRPVRDVFLLAAPASSATPTAHVPTPSSPATPPTRASAGCWRRPVPPMICTTCSGSSAERPWRVAPFSFRTAGRGHTAHLPYSPTTTRARPPSATPLSGWSFRLPSPTPFTKGHDARRGGAPDSETPIARV